jgi:hypothetical protein
MREWKMEDALMSRKEKSCARDFHAEPLLLSSRAIIVLYDLLGAR